MKRNNINVTTSKEKIFEIFTVITFLIVVFWAMKLWLPRFWTNYGQFMLLLDTQVYSEQTTGHASHKIPVFQKLLKYSRKGIGFFSI
jgi:hypothetical protein